MKATIFAGDNVENNEEKLQNDTSISDNENQELWWLLLFGLLQDDLQNRWNEFTEQLMYDDRFSSSHEIVKLIKDLGKQVTSILPKGKELFRARIYHDNPLEDFIHDFYASKSGDSSMPDGINIGSIDWSKNANTLVYPLIGTLDKNGALQKSFFEKYQKWQDSSFRGYNESDSDMPPKGKAPEGRINPDKISYLYLAEEAQTCIYEVRPIIGQHVSVATFVTQKDLRIYNLAYKFPNDYPNEEKLNISLFEYVCQQFSKPYTGKPLQYLPTQFLGEVIKNMGFDGLRFSSSLNKGGYNVVLFNNEFCKPVSSDFVRVDGINLTISNPDLYLLEESMKKHP